MSLSELPEERVQDILSYLLCVPHAVFNKPGRWRSQPAHQVLEVCRLWLRVGTPLLYECLVLTKTKHTASVAELFRAHPHVGTAVRCLKLQGAFGQELREVVQFIPQRLESLYIYMYMHDPRDVYDGYFMALPALKPETLYLQGRLGHAPVGMTEKIDKTISNLIRDGTWSLHTFVCARNDAYYFTDTLAAALSASSTLQRMVIDPYYLLVRAFLSKVGAVAMNPNLREITCSPGKQSGGLSSAPINLQDIWPREKNDVVRGRLRQLLMFPRT